MKRSYSIATTATIASVVCAGFMGASILPEAAEAAPVTTTSISPITSKVVNSSTIVINWTAASNPAKGWTYGRDGYDATGEGAWSGTLNGTKRSAQFNYLKSGQNYKVFVKNNDTGQIVHATINSNGTAIPTPTVNFNLKVVTVDADSVKITWNSSSKPAKGWEAKRNGKDNTGYGEWKEVVSGTRNYYQFDKLVSGKTYNFTLTNMSTGKSQVVSYKVGSGSVTPPPTPTNPKPTNPKPTNPKPPTSSVGTASGLPWQSGVFPMHKATVANEFAAKRGKQLDVITIFPERTNWSKMKEGWVIDNTRIPSNFKGRLDVGVPLYPNDSNVNAAAAGKYNQDWEQFARMIAAKYPNSYIRLGWEMNLPGWHAHATPANSEQWKQAYRQAVTSIRKGGPNLKIAWVVNEGPGQTGTQDASMFYPGDAYVDYIGMDAYDWWPGYTTDANIAKHRDGAYGWNHWMNFAKAHNKKFVLPEWGVAPANSASGGDNPKYINFVYDYLNKNRNWVEYESYFQESENYIDADLFTNNYKSSNEYVRWMNILSSK